MMLAYALLGVAFVCIIGGALVLSSRTDETNMPSNEDTVPPPPRPPLTLTSPAFGPGSLIPSQFTCDGSNINPTLLIKNPPEGTASYVLTVEDPDIPQAVKERLDIEIFNHYVLYNIPSSTIEIPEANTTVGTAGKNTRGMGYTGPCPPPEYEPREHRYIFQVHALDTALEAREGISKEELMTLIEGHVLATAFLIGRYERPTPTP
jgi:Raf kinase inhibitor-like YbhB/YbcL family protein